MIAAGGGLDTLMFGRYMYTALMKKHRAGVLWLSRSLPSIDQGHIATGFSRSVVSPRCDGMYEIGPDHLIV